MGSIWTLDLAWFTRENGGDLRTEVFNVMRFDEMRMMDYIVYGI